MNLNRRDFLIGTSALAAGASVSVPFFLPKYHLDRKEKRSRVAIINVGHYYLRHFSWADESGALLDVYRDRDRLRLDAHGFGLDDSPLRHAAYNLAFGLLGRL